MAILNFAKVTAIKVADVDSEGAMPSSGLEQVAGLKKGSGQLSVSDPEESKEYIEESDLAFATKLGSRDANFTGEFIGVSTQVIAGLMGADYSAADASNPETLSIVGSPTVQKAVQIEGENSDGLPIKVQLPKTKVSWSIPGAIGKDETRGIQLKFSIEQPLNSSGELQDWIYIPVGNTA